MKIQLRYARASIDVEVPDCAHILRLQASAPVADEHEGIVSSLRSPQGCISLDSLAAGRDNACIVVCDLTRPVPNEKLLMPLLACLHDSGIAESKITILVATGLHRPNTESELQEMLGSEIARKYLVINHDARDADMNSSLGEVPFGEDGQSATVAINKHYLNADLKITTGLIEPHFMAGYSGGRKLVCPGIASAETILQFHAPHMIAHPQARTGNLRDNPVHLMSRTVATKASMDFMCNVTLSEDRRITGVFSGAMDAAHNAGVEHVDRQSKVSCQPADIVITSGAGFPLDATFYQSIKAMVGALPAVKPGGTIIVAASMSEGIGGREFAAMCESFVSREAFTETIFSAPSVTIDQWQLQKMTIALEKAQIMVVTEGVSPEFLRRCQLTPMPTLADALDAARKIHGNAATITVIPEGPYVTPVPVI